MSRITAAPVSTPRFRAVLALVLAATAAPGQYLAVRAAGANTSGSLVIAAGLGDVDLNGLHEAFVQTTSTLSMIADVWNASAAQIAAPVVVASCVGHTLARVNGDALPDLIIATQSPTAATLAVMLGTGAGTFGAPVPVANITALGGFFLNVGPANVGRVLQAHDFNGDGLDDVVVLGNSMAALYVNTGAAWTPAWSTAAVASYVSGHATRLGDFNGDGLKDLVFAPASVPQQILVWYGVPGGLATTVIALIPPPATNGGYLFDAADVDGDGFDDVVLREHTSVPGMVGVWVVYGGAGGLAFVPQSALTTTLFSSQFPSVACAIVDLDADGIKDLVGVDAWIGTTIFVVARGLGSRAFAYRHNGYATVAAPVLDGSVPIYADLDADGDADAFSFSHLGGNLHTVLDNRATVATGCPGAAGTPAFPVSSAWWGNPAFTLGLLGAAPNAPAVLVVSTVSTAGPGCGPGPSLLPSNVVLPAGALGILTTSPSGAASLSSSLPAIPALYGLRVFAQWGGSDTTGAFSVGGASFALSPMRTICIF